MPNVNVTFQELEQAASRLQSGESDLGTILTQLQNYIQNLVSSGFVTDAASVSFSEAYNKFTTSARTGLEALSSMASYLRTAATRYSETDQSLTVSFD